MSAHLLLRAPLAVALVVFGSACVSPDAANRPPIANAGKDLRAVKFEDDVFVQLKGGASHDPDGSSIEWRWDVVRSPGTLILAGDQRVSPEPIVGLGAVGLHIFRLTARDLEGAESYDFVNVYVVDGLVIDEPPVPDFGVTDDAGPVEDAGPRPDDGVPDDAALPSDGGLIQDAGDDEDAAVGENRPPQPAIGAVADRVELGQPLELDGSGSRDEAPLELTYRWRVVQVPNGVDFDFEAEGLRVRFVPPAAGRYTVRLSVSDGEFERATDRSFYVRFDQVWIFSPEIGRADARAREDGVPSASSVLFGPLEMPATSFAARAGILYAALRGGGDISPVLAIAAPGAGLNRRALPATGRTGQVRAGVDGVWVSMQAAAALFFTDPTGRAPLRTLNMEAAYSNGYGLAIDGQTGWVVNRSQPRSVLELDLRRRVVVGEVYRDEALCELLDVAADAERVYTTCRAQNAALSIPRAGGLVDRSNRLPLSGPSGVRAAKILRLGDQIVVMHRRQTYATHVPTVDFELPVGDPQREREAMAQLNVIGEIIDIAGTADTVYVLSINAEGATRITAFELPSGAVMWGRATGLRGATLLAVDAADDFERDLGAL